MDESQGSRGSCFVSHQRYETTELEEQFETTLSYTEESYMDDEVFLTFDSEKPVVISKTQRIRRVSDVMDSTGDGTVETRPCSTSEVHTPRGPLSSSPPESHLSDAGYSSPTVKTVREKWKTQSLSDGRPSDSTDAQPMGISSSLSHSRSSTAIPECLMPVKRDSTEYNMDHPRRGHAIIFNHETFSNKPPRTGSHVDVDRLEKVYSQLGFQVDIYHDLKQEEIFQVLTKMSEQDHTDCDCFVVTVLTHGMNNNWLFSRDYPYSCEQLWEPFKPNYCKTLAGKPKIFIIQACRGDAVDGGVRLVSLTEVDSAVSESYKIPLMADFMFAYSTTEGHCSWRNPEDGTWFIKSLCEVFNQNHTTMDLQKMLTRVCYKVAVEYESYNDYIFNLHERKQVPQICSTLIRDVYFRPKKD